MTAATPAVPRPRRAGGGKTAPYKPHNRGQRQCSCGSRQWEITTGGILPPTVNCARCHAQSRMNTLYELGREDGRREARNDHSDPGF